MASIAGGAPAERWNAKRPLIAFDLVRAVAVGAIPRGEFLGVRLGFLLAGAILISGAFASWCSTVSALLSRDVLAN